MIPLSVLRLCWGFVYRFFEKRCRKKGQKCIYQCRKVLCESSDKWIFLIVYIYIFFFFFNLIKPVMARPYEDIFSGFPGILRSWKRDNKTTLNNFWSCHMHFYTFSFTNSLSQNSCTDNIRTDDIYIFRLFKQAPI